MSERQPDHQTRGEHALHCAVCGASSGAVDRFCAQCGAPLPEGNMPPSASAPAETRGEERPAWVLGARPTAVIVGGIALLLLAVLLLAVGQIDDTGTIVMLAICTAPLGLLILLIGIGRYVAGAARR